MKYLIEMGMDVNCKVTNSQSTPMTISVLNGNYDMVKYLLENGGDFLYEWNKIKVKDVSFTKRLNKLFPLLSFIKSLKCLTNIL